MTNPTAYHRTVVQLRNVLAKPANNSTPAGFSGVAVPYNTMITLAPGVREQVAPGAVEAHDGQLWWRHTEIIGCVPAASDTPEGWCIDATISDTTLGRDAAALMRDGAVRQLSIGFEPLEWTETADDDGGITITHTRMHVREVSLVPHPAYETATITEVRQEGPTTMPNSVTTITAADLDAVRGDIADMKRSLAAVSVAERPAATDHRSAGVLLKSALAGDDTAIATLSVPYSREYTGGTSGDDFGRATWATDLTRIIEAADRLAGVFSEGTLPETGMTLEFGRLKSNTVTVAKQTKEGEPLPKGNVKVETASVAVETYGGAAELSVQEMKRSQAPLIDMHMRALAVAAGAQRAKAKLTALNTLIAKQDGNAIAVTGDGWKPWVPALTTVAQRMTALGLGLNGLLLPEADWNKLAQLEDSTGRPMLATAGATVNTVGVFNATTLDGQLLQVPTRMVPGLTKPVFFNKLALRDYTSPLVRVNNDLHALDLTAALGVYQFGAIADEVPTAVVPVAIS